jgi:hypothetical protein
VTLKPILKTIYIDPPSRAYYEDRLFDVSDKVLNRDDALMPFFKLRTFQKLKGVEVHTADFLMAQNNEERASEYYSLGVLDNYKTLLNRIDVRKKAFVIFEPPVVDPRLYRALPELTAAFEYVYVHNVIGDGYSLKGVDISKLRQLYWPQPRNEVIEAYWVRTDRMDRIVVINSNHIPRKVFNELYSKRIEAMVSLAKLGVVDLYGRGWAKWWSRASMWLPYWKNCKSLMSIYKGACASKYEVLSQYKFCLCFENMVMKGYVTEKIFDCLYAGTIPLYLGATDIQDLIPQDVYVDCRKFSSWQEMYRAVECISPSEIQQMREKGKSFIQSAQGAKYYNSLIKIFNEELQVTS